MSKHQKFNTTERIVVFWQMVMKSSPEGNGLPCVRPDMNNFEWILRYALFKCHSGFQITMDFASFSALNDEEQWDVLHSGEYEFLDNEDQSDPDNTLAAIVQRLRAKFAPDGGYDYQINTVYVDVALKHDAKRLRRKEQEEQRAKSDKRQKENSL